MKLISPAVSTLNLDVSKLVFEKFAYKNRASNIIKNFFKVLAGIPDNKFNEKTFDPKENHFYLNATTHFE